MTNKELLATSVTDMGTAQLQEAAILAKNLIDLIATQLDEEHKVQFLNNCGAAEARLYLRRNSI